MVQRREFKLFPGKVSKQRTKSKPKKLPVEGDRLVMLIPPLALEFSDDEEPEVENELV